MLSFSQASQGPTPSRILANKFGAACSLGMSPIGGVALSQERTNLSNTLQQEPSSLECDVPFSQDLSQNYLW
jgi:hypothetical protein